MEDSKSYGRGLMGLGFASRLCLFVAFIAGVYFLGTSLFSAHRMEPLFYPYFRSLFHVSAPGQLFYYLSVVRWIAHFLEYFTLFLLLSWLLGLRPLTALIVCLLIAGADEGHQYFLPDRSCSLRDLTLDMAGAATALLLTIAARYIRARPHLADKMAPEQTRRAPA
ncbi:MAG TPA: VanZ family protein [Candidatus Binataceae bacterium]|jgi:VanZ family protein|nr:VanZ family protein [Candidatus Binataceae bacterium]